MLCKPLDGPSFPDTGSSLTLNSVKVLRKHKILLNKAETEQIAQLQQELTPVNKTIQTAYIKLGGKLKDKLV